VEAEEIHRVARHRRRRRRRLFLDPVQQHMRERVADRAAGDVAA